MRAWTHVHTEASGDSDLTPEELRAAAGRHGVRIVFVTEHREALDDYGIDRVARSLRDLSDDRVLLVPGLEVASEERWHVLAFGLVRPVPRLPAERLAGAIRDAGGVPVLAHPCRYGPEFEASLPTIGAVEVWNRHYDGRLGPGHAALRALRRLPGVRATFGLDAHGREALTGTLPALVLDGSDATEAAALDALREGRYRLVHGDREIDPLALSLFRRLVDGGYRGARRAARRVGRLLPLSEKLRIRLGRRF